MSWSVAQASYQLKCCMQLQDQSVNRANNVWEGNQYWPFLRRKYVRRSNTDVPWNHRSQRGRRCEAKRPRTKGLWRVAWSKGHLFSNLVGWSWPHFGIYSVTNPYWLRWEDHVPHKRFLNKVQEPNMSIDWNDSSRGTGIMSYISCFHQRLPSDCWSCGLARKRYLTHSSDCPSIPSTILIHDVKHVTFYSSGEGNSARDTQHTFHMFKFMFSLQFLSFGPLGLFGYILGCGHRCMLLGFWCVCGCRECTLATCLEQLVGREKPKKHCTHMSS